MKKSSIVAILIGAVCVILFTHPELWKQYFPTGAKALFNNNNLSGPFAWKTMSREGFTGPYNITVELMDGDKWRVEAKSAGAPKAAVAVSDGWKVVSKPMTTKAAALDPRPGAKGLLGQLALMKDYSSKTADRRDGHACWRFDINNEGTPAQLWVDSTTLFPVCLATMVDGKITETHFAPVVNADIAAHGAEYFDTEKTDPMFADELEHEIDIAQGGAPGARASAVSTPTPPKIHYYLKSPVAVHMAYGEVSVPAHTEVQILGGDGRTHHVSGGGQEFDVPDDQLTKVSQ